MYFNAPVANATRHSWVTTNQDMFLRDKGISYHFQDKLAPQTPEEAQLPESVVDVSSNFVEIYNQALAAEAFGLDQITGIGLRKALEFLIKDFLINQNPQSADEVKAKMLGKCIDENVTDANIKATAKLATWLGNDETRLRAHMGGQGHHRFESFN